MSYTLPVERDPIEAPSHSLVLIISNNDEAGFAYKRLGKWHWVLSHLSHSKPVKEGVRCWCSLADTLVEAKP